MTEYQSGEGEKVTWYLRPAVVIILLFFVLGPLALPLLYKSPRFTSTWKVVLTVVTVVYTVYAIIVSVKLGQEIYRATESALR